MKDVMIDFETLGTSADAPVVQIGACYFDRKTGEIGRTFKVNVSLASGVQSGAVIDASTVEWWVNQSEEARKSVFTEDSEDITRAFGEFNKFLQGSQYIWSHATFDFPILQQTLKRLGIKPWFKYKFARDIRTLQDLAGYPEGQTKREGIHHDALDDCKFQVVYCVAAFKILERK